VKEQIGNWQKFLERLWHAACRPSWAVDTSQLEFSEGSAPVIKKKFSSKKA
jgi:hypothetical protein